MREDHKPGDLSARISFGRVMGTGANAGQVCPRLSITCETSGLNLDLELTPEQFVDMMSGRAAQVPANRVHGFRGISNWGRYSRHITRTVDVRPGDWKMDIDAAELPHVAAVIAGLEADGWRVDAPRRNNGGKWVILGRKYVKA